jgi:hypothetical protein
MSTTVAVPDWIKRVADDERQRDATRAKQIERDARKVDLVGRHGRRLIDELNAAVVRDVGAFCDEFAGDRSRNVVVDVALPAGGFVVLKPAPSAVSLTVTANTAPASLLCSYSFALTDGLPPREDRVHIMFIDDGGETLRMKHHGTEKMFASADDLSEFLLIPVLTGRPR